MRNLSKTVLGAVIAVGLTASAAFATVPAQTNCAYSFSTNMKLGAVSSDVMNLQKLLNLDVRTQVSASGVGSAGRETARFGPATFAAVKKFQAANGVSPVSGFAGPLTRAMLNTVCNGTAATGTTPVVQSGPITVSAAASQPNVTLVAGQAAAVLGNFAFSGNGSISQVEFMRTGISSNDVLTNVYLYEGNTRLTDSASVLSDGTIRFTAPWTVAGSRNISVRSDIACQGVSPCLSSVSGQTIGVAVKSVTVTGATSTPVVGVMSGLQAIASADLAKVSFTSQTVTANTNLSIPQTNFSVWRVGANVSTRAVKLKGLAVKMIGSAPTNALTNVSLFVDSAKVASGSIDGNMRFVFDLSSAPITMTTGGHTIEVRGDVVTGSTRDFKFSLENSADIMLEDSILAGTNVSVDAVGFSTYKEAGKQTLSGVSNTSLVVQKDTSFSDNNVVGGTSNVTVGKFKVTSYGEDAKIQTVKITPSTNTLSNVGLYVNGAQVGSSNNSGPNSGADYEFTLGSSFIASVGVSYVVEVKADLRNRVSGINIPNATVLQASVASMSGQGQFSQNTFTQTGPIAGQQMTVGGTVVTVGTTVGGVSATASADSTNVKIGSFQVRAGSIESINVRDMVLNLAGTAPTNLIRNIKLVANGTQFGSQVGTGAAAQTFSGSLDVNSGNTITVDVMADLGLITVGNTIIPTLNVAYTGKTSNQSNTENHSGTANTVAVQTVTTGVPTLSSRLASQYVLGGATVGSVGVYNFTSANGKSKINDLTFTVTGTGVQSIKLNGVSASPISGTAIFTNINLDVPSGTQGVNFPVEVTFSPAYVGTGSGVPSGSTALVSLTGMKATPEGGSQAVTSPAVALNTMTLITSMPSVAKVTNSGTSLGVNGALVGVKVGSITVKADTAGDIVVGTLAYTLSAPAALTNWKVRVGGQNAQDKLGAIPVPTATDVTFAAGYRITAGQTVTFDVFADVAAVTSGNTGTTVANVGAPASFLWSDDVSTAGTNRAGTLLPVAKYEQ